MDLKIGVFKVLLLNAVRKVIEVNGAVSFTEEVLCGDGMDGAGNTAVENTIEETGKLANDTVSVLLEDLFLLTSKTSELDRTNVREFVTVARILVVEAIGSVELLSLA